MKSNFLLIVSIFSITLIIWDINLILISYFIFVVFLNQSRLIKRRQGVSPITAHIIGWLIPSILFLTITNFKNYKYFEINFNVVIAIILSSVSFIIGSFIGNNIRITPSNNINKSKKLIDLKRLITPLTLLGLIGLFHNLLNIVRAGGASLYLTGGLRNVEKIFGSSTLMNYFYFCLAPLLAFKSLQLYLRKDYSRYSILFLIFIIISLMLHGVKGTVIYPVFITIYLLLQYGYRPSKKIIIYGSILIVSVFQVITIGRELPFLINRGLTIKEIVLTGIEKPILYLTSGFTNLQLELKYVSDYMYGKFTFGGFYQLFNFFLGTNRELVIQQSELFLVDKSYNTATYLRSLNRDFGYLGIVFGPFIYGSIGGYLYNKAYILQSLSLRYTYAIYLTMVTGMFFSNHFLKIQYIFWVLLIFLILKIKCKRLDS